MVLFFHQKVQDYFEKNLAFLFIDFKRLDQDSVGREEQYLCIQICYQILIFSSEFNAYQDLYHYSCIACFTKKTINL